MMLRLTLFIALMSLLFFGHLAGQGCAFPPCADTDCGDLNTKFAPVGGPSFCDGDTIILQNTSDPGFNYFVVDWKDGTVDTQLNYNQFRHIYIVPESLLCQTPNHIFYQVCFKGVKDCPAGTSCQSGGYDFKVLKRPKARFDGAQEVCIETLVNFTDMSCNATTYEWDFGDGLTSTDKNPSHKYSGTGIYTVTLRVTNNCGQDVTFRQIRVVDHPKADFKHLLNPSIACGPVVDSFTNLSNVWSNTEWTITPADTSKWVFTDTLMTLGSRHIKVHFKKSGTYVVQLRAFNVCGEDFIRDTIKVYDPPMVSIQAPPASCDQAVVTSNSLGFSWSGEITDFLWTFTNGVPGSATGTQFPAVTFTSSGSVTLVTLSPCGNDTLTVPVTVAVTDPIDLAGNPSQLCANGLPVQLQASPAGGIWTGKGGAAGAVTAGGMLNPSLLSPGQYTFSYSLGSVDCPNSQDLTLTILPAVSVDLATPQPACDEMFFVPAVVYGGGIGTYQWSFPGGSPATSNLQNPGTIHFPSPGVYTVVISVNGFCGTAVDSVSLIVQASTPLVIDPLPPLICSTSDPIVLTANVPGGTWSGPGIVNPVLGIFDPSLVSPGQQVTIAYGFQAGPCQNATSITFQVTPSESVNIQDGLLCEDSAPLTLVSDRPGGTWSGIGVTDPTAGIFSAQVAGIGSFPVTYLWTDPSGCPVSATTDIVVEAFPVLGLADTTLLCLTGDDIALPAVLGFSASPTGGTATWSGPGIQTSQGTFNSLAAGLSPGYHTVEVLYTRNACVVRDSGVIELIANPVLSVSPDTTLCIDVGTLALFANLASGQWSGPGVNASTGMVDLNAAGGGFHTYTYVFEPGTSCTQTASVTLEIIDPASGLNPGPDVQVCEGPGTYTLTGFSPAGGLWSGPGIMDATLGFIDLGVLALDSFYTYTYCLESTLVDGCSACRTRNLRINARPDIQFSFDGLPCIGETFSVINASVNASGHAWNFGDGTSSTLSEPSHVYTQPGTFTLSYIATSPLGCKDTFSQQVFVTTPPVADFSVLVDEGCAPFLVQVSNQSSGYQISQLWIIQEDSIPGVDPGQVYIDNIISDTLMTIRLEVTNVCGTRIHEEDVLVRPYPVVNFGFNVDEGCSPLEIHFANITLGNPETFWWDLGNGMTSSAWVPPSQIYSTPDSVVSVYPITLISTNACGADTMTREITVYPPDVQAFIGMDTLAGCEPFTIAPGNFSTPGSMYSWVISNVQGDVVASSNAQHPEFTISGAGTYRILLYASRCGTDVDTAWFEVLPAPEVAFSHHSHVCQGEAIRFTDESIGTTAYFWEFGDGQTSTDIHPGHVYAQAGQYTVRLTARSLINDCPATFESVVTVVGQPDAAFDPGIFQGCPPLSIPFVNASVGGDSLLYVWTFSDGSSSSFDKDPVHIFWQPGQYAVSLISYDAFGCFSDTAQGLVTVHPEPVAAFEVAGATLCHGHDTLHLQNTSQGAVSYLWTIGGASYTMAEPAVVPQSPGSLPIRLEVLNAYQCRDTIDRTVEVLPSPLAKGGVSINAGCEDLRVVFFNESEAGDLYFWDFGNGNLSTDWAPEHLYTEAGTYLPTLVVRSTNGCPADTAFWTVTVHPVPVAQFVYTPSHLCGVPMNVSFANQSLGSQDHDWDFGNGAFSEVASPSAIYTETGEHLVRLIETNIYGCSDTTSQWVDIYGQPLADFEIPVHQGCQPMRVVVQNTSEQALTYHWWVSPAFESPDAVPELLLHEPGIYSVRLVAIYNDQCRDTLELMDAIRVFQTPMAAFQWQADENENILGDVLFINESEMADRFLWDLGDGTISAAVDVAHEYDINRSIQVVLQAFNDNNGLYTCIDTALQLIDPEWITTFYAPNAMTPGYGAAGIRVFKPVGIGIEDYEIAVYSPWGERVWQSTELINHRPSGAWDGTYRGEVVPQGSYTWLARIRFVDGTVRIAKGSVTVLR
jgi:PKD repeat protein